MIREPECAVRVCRDLAEYVMAADGWRPARPFPLLPGPALDRYAASLGVPGRDAWPGLPAVRPESRPGIVISTGGDFSRAVGRLLAKATGRPSRHVPVARLLAAVAAEPDELTAVVALGGELSAAGDWPGRAGHRVGVLTGRSEGSLACLIYRSLTVGAPPEQDRVFTVSHPLLDGAMEADAVYFSDLRPLTKDRARLVVLRGQGRECSLSLLDGVICGRAAPLGQPIPAEPGLRATPCLAGEGCFRTDLDADEMLPAAQVQATVIFSQSCSAISIGANAYPLSISLSLELLEGTAVAVIGVLGVHVVHPSAQWDLEDALADGLPLGDAVRRLGEQGRPQNGELTRFGLLGDPALTLPGGLARAARPRPRLDLEAGAALAQLEQTASRLLRLQWLELDVGDGHLADIRRRLRHAARDLFDPAAGDLARQLAADLAAFQYEIVSALVTRIHGPGWDPSWRSTGFEQVSKQDTTCPGCGRPIAVLLVMRHRVDCDLYLQTLQCRRCGDVWWNTEPGPCTIELRGPLDREARRGENVLVEREIVNHGGRTVRGAVGYAFRRRKNLGLPPGHCEQRELGPGEHSAYRASISLAGASAAADTHSLLVVALLDGVLVSSMCMLHLT